jgi:hypothetical protein
VVPVHGTPLRSLSSIPNSRPPDDSRGRTTS